MSLLVLNLLFGFHFLRISGLEFQFSQFLAAVHHVPTRITSLHIEVFVTQGV